MEFPLTTPNAQIEAVVTKLAESPLISAECFDVFTGKKNRRPSESARSADEWAWLEIPMRSLGGLLSQ
jgi:hypothetical protein